MNLVEGIEIITIFRSISNKEQAEKAKALLNIDSDKAFKYMKKVIGDYNER